ncbi:MULTISPECIES: hypothetical protein [Spartinivicinus]|nr:MULTISPECIES: hypothetical protein [Spartinivicinus]MDE1464272.1 hypothetical protein [Spartinivicinus sp. A2-2]
MQYILFITLVTGYGAIHTQEVEGFLSKSQCEEAKQKIISNNRKELGVSALGVCVQKGVIRH